MLLTGVATNRGVGGRHTGQLADTFLTVFPSLIHHDKSHHHHTRNMVAETRPYNFFKGCTQEFIRDYVVLKNMPRKPAQYLQNIAVIAEDRQQRLKTPEPFSPIFIPHTPGFLAVVFPSFSVRPLMPLPCILPPHRALPAVVTGNRRSSKVNIPDRYTLPSSGTRIIQNSLLARPRRTSVQLGICWLPSGRSPLHERGLATGRVLPALEYLTGSERTADGKSNVPPPIYVKTCDKKVASIAGFLGHADLPDYRAR